MTFDDSSLAPFLTDTGSLTGSTMALSVTALSQLLRHVVENRFASIQVRGEVSGPKRHTSGHLYFTLKDENSVLDAVCWRPQATRYGQYLTEGAEVICTGRITTYPMRSKYQVVVDSVTLAGEGALLKLLEQLKQKLKAEGLFDLNRKKPLPFLPRAIGIITSPTGAVIRDILHRLADRLPCHVYVWPVAVQGESAARDIAAAIRGLNTLSLHLPPPHPDVLIVARGGGSLEDLAAFNDESVVRATATSVIPVISAVGHETDTTLIDYAADIRAPTPTAAAEFAVPVRLQLLQDLTTRGTQLRGHLKRLLDTSGLRIQLVQRRLTHTLHALQTLEQRMDDSGARLNRAWPPFFRRKGDHISLLVAGIKTPSWVLSRNQLKFVHVCDQVNSLILRRLTLCADRLSRSVHILEALSYKKTLARGFSIIQNTQGGVITSALTVGPGQDVTVHFQDGIVNAQITSL